MVQSGEDTDGLLETLRKWSSRVIKKVKMDTYSQPTNLDTKVFELLTKVAVTYLKMLLGMPHHNSFYNS